MDIPQEVMEFFSGAGGINVLASPRFLQKHNGSSRVNLPDHDIYHVGKGEDQGPVYTVYRILAKESMHNTIQGVLRVVFKSGHALTRDAKLSPETPVIMRPNDMKKLVTVGTTSIKRNSVLVFSTGIVVRLEDVENFCDLPILDKEDLYKVQKESSIYKREVYKLTRGTDNWAHVKRDSLVRDMEKSVHKILLPYYRKFRGDDDPEYFFKAFMEDVVRTCNAHHENFVTEDGDFDSMVSTISSCRKRSSSNLKTETRPRKKWGKSQPAGQDRKSNPNDTVRETLKNVSKDKIASIVF